MNPNSKALAVLQSPLFRDHRALGAHPECPERLVAAELGLAEAVAKAPAVSILAVEPRPATQTELERVHSTAYLAELSAIRGRQGELDGDTFFSSGSLTAAEHAAGGAIELCRTLLEGGAGVGVGLLRPPGHHATADRAMGFCLLNNVALAAAHALANGIDRVLIFDWDVHHGNGTQDIFYSDPRVLFCSVHQHPLYPGTGRHTEQGEALGRGFTINVPLSRGAGDDVYLDVLERLLLAVMQQFRPGLVLVSAGYDAHEDDPLGQMRVTNRGFGAMSHRLAAAAKDLASPIGFLLEGGYNLPALQGAVMATVLGALQGNRGALAQARDPAEIAPVHLPEIDQALVVQRAFWRV